MEELTIRLLNGFSDLINGIAELITAYPWIGYAFPFLPAIPALVYRAILASVVIAALGFVSLLLMITKGHIGLLMWLALWVVSFVAGINKSEQRKAARHQQTIAST